MQNPAISLFDSIKIGPTQLQNRIVMAPMTRCRAEAQRVPNALMAEYYEQRASAGLILTEATQVSERGIGYINTPGIHSAEQVQGWRRVTSAVHAKGGKIFLQLWHVGRVSHVSFQPNGEAPVAPSAITLEGETWTPVGKVAHSAPRALEESEIPGVVAEYELGARLAREAGFDGVEIHGANGYLIDQFLRDGTNRRSDRYGGSIQNRMRFALEVTDAVIGVWGPERVGFRVSPVNPFNGMHDSNPAPLFSALATELSAKKLAYLHVIEGAADVLPEGRITPLLRRRFDAALIANTGHTLESASQLLAEGGADLVAFGAPFIANPDLVQRFQRGLPLAVPDVATFYTAGAQGYTTYASAP